MKPPKRCPYCNSGIKQASRLRNQYSGDTYMTPVIYKCGTVASENWSPPVQDKNCGKPALTLVQP